MSKTRLFLCAALKGVLVLAAAFLGLFVLGVFMKWLLSTTVGAALFFVALLAGVVFLLGGLFHLCYLHCKGER